MTTGEVGGDRLVSLEEDVNSAKEFIKKLSPQLGDWAVSLQKSASVGIDVASLLRVRSNSRHTTAPNEEPSTDNRSKAQRTLQSSYEASMQTVIRMCEMQQRLSEDLLAILPTIEDFITSDLELGNAQRSLYDRAMKKFQHSQENLTQKSLATKGDSKKIFRIEKECNEAMENLSGTRARTLRTFEQLSLRAIGFELSTLARVYDGFGRLFEAGNAANTSVQANQLVWASYANKLLASNIEVGASGGGGFTGDVIHEGALLCKGASGSWVKRWAVVRPGSLLVHDKSSASSKKLKFVVQLDECCVQRSDRKKHCFAVNHSDRAWYFCSRTDDERSTWIEKIRSCIVHPLEHTDVEHSLLRRDSSSLNIRQSSGRWVTDESGSFFGDGGSATDLGPIASSSHDVNRSGFLEKKGGVRTNWKRRWCVLEATDTGERVLRYFKDAKDTNPKGVVDLTLCSSVDEREDVRRFCIGLVLPNRTYLFCAKSATEKNDWIRDLTHAVMHDDSVLKLRSALQDLNAPVITTEDVDAPLESNIDEYDDATSSSSIPHSSQGRRPPSALRPRVVADKPRRPTTDLPPTPGGAPAVQRSVTPTSPPARPVRRPSITRAHSPLGRGKSPDHSEENSLDDLAPPPARAAPRPPSPRAPSVEDIERLAANASSFLSGPPRRPPPRPAM